MRPDPMDVTLAEHRYHGAIEGRPGYTLRRVRGAIDIAVMQAQAHRQHGREEYARQALADAEREVWRILSARFGRARVMKRMHRIRAFMDRARANAGADLFSAGGA